MLLLIMISQSFCFVLYFALALRLFFHSVFVSHSWHLIYIRYKYCNICMCMCMYICLCAFITLLAFMPLFAKHFLLILFIVVVAMLPTSVTMSVLYCFLLICFLLQCNTPITATTQTKQRMPLACLTIEFCCYKSAALHSACPAP